MRAISTFSFDAGTSIFACFALTPFRMRVSMSAIGSVISSVPWRRPQGPRPPAGGRPATTHDGLPAALRHARDVALEREAPEAEPAQRELPQVAAGAAADPAPVAMPRRVLERLALPSDLRCRRHQLLRNGRPISCSSLRASSSVFAVVTTDTFMPRGLSTFM